MDYSQNLGILAFELARLGWVGAKVLVFWFIHFFKNMVKLWNLSLQKLYKCTKFYISFQMYGPSEAHPRLV